MESGIHDKSVQKNMRRNELRMSSLAMSARRIFSFLLKIDFLMNLEARAQHAMPASIIKIMASVEAVVLAQNVENPILHKKAVMSVTASLIILVFRCFPGIIP